MKKLITILLLSLMLVGCGTSNEANFGGIFEESRFEIVEVDSCWYVVVDRETRVMYAVSTGTYNCGTFTLLVDADGYPLIWKGESE